MPGGLSLKSPPPPWCPLQQHTGPAGLPHKVLLSKQTGALKTIRSAVRAEAAATVCAHHCCCRRYQLPVEPPLKSASAAVALAAIDAQESDAELRADLMANALLLPLLGEQHSYSMTGGHDMA